MMALKVCPLSVLLVCIVVQLGTPVQADQDVLLLGCPGSYVHLQCSDDENIKIKDIQMIQNDEDVGGTPCPVNDLPGPVPEELQDLIESSDDRYESGVCEDESECAFYISRQDLGASTMDKTMQLTYECAAGTGRKAGMIVLVIVGVVAFIVFLALIILLVRRHWSEEEEDYSAFANVSRSSSVHTLESRQAAKNGPPAAGGAPGTSEGGYDQNQNAPKEAETSLEHVAVSLEVPSEKEPSATFTKA